MSTSNFKVYMSSNIAQFRKKLNNIIANYDQYFDTILEDICKEIVLEARQRLLLSRYDVGDLLENITYQKYGKGKYRVGVKNNREKDVMYFLEFGTGIVGSENPHPDSEKIGWQYIMNPENLVENSYSSGHNIIGDYVVNSGWWYFNEKTQKYEFTSGLKAVRYFYDTINKENIDNIVERVKQKHRNLKNEL